MTDIAKAVAFATRCLKWTSVSTAETPQGALICDGGSNRTLNPDSLADLQRVLEEFLGKRYFMQINRGTSSLFHWRAMVGLQDLSVKDACWDHAIGLGEDLWDAIFDACVQAAHIDKRES